MSTLSRWPLLLGAGIAWGAAIGVDLSGGDTASALLVEALLIGGAFLIGAFTYAEGVRWRERREQLGDDAG